MIGAVLAVLALAQPAVQLDSVRLCVRDAVNEAPLVGGQLRFANGTTRTMQSDCTHIARGTDTVMVARLGYRPRAVQVGGSVSASPGIVVIVSLTPRTVDIAETSVTVLDVQQVRADAPVSARAGAVQASISTEVARERGTTTMNGLITLLPFTAMRSARGESGLSLRGARREQVVVTLDGLPLNDPATGLADVADVPLVAIQSATVVPGADPVNVGSGANGGVLSLSSAANRMVSVRGGAFGQWATEAAYTITRNDTRWQSSVAHRRAVNDFPFVNDAGVTPVREARVNNDEVRTVLTASALAPRTQWLLLASTGERGMVGAANVRAYDEDRSRTTRVFVRGQTAFGNTSVVTGARRFDLRYRDPQRPVLDSRAMAWAADAEWRGRARLGAWRIGAGADHLDGTGNVVQRRARGFAAWSWQTPVSPPRDVAIDAGVRTDIVEGQDIQPTGSIGATWRVRGTAHGSSWSLLGRGAQALRVPTLYDLYFSSPQRLSVRALDPERVTLDASAGTRLVWQGPRTRAVFEGTLVSRDTRNAIVWFPGNFGWSPANVGLERLRGTEMRADVGMARVTLSGWHTFYRSELRSGTLLIPTPYVPQHSGAANIAWHLGQHTLSAHTRYQGRRPFTAGPRNPLFELPAVTVTDVAWSQRHAFAGVDALWSLTIDNVTDAQWQSVRGFPMPGRGWSASLTLAPRP